MITLDDYLEEKGVLDEVNLKAFKSVFCDNIRLAMYEKCLKPEDLAERMGITVKQVRQILDEKDLAIDLITIFRTCKAVGLDFCPQFIDTTGHMSMTDKEIVNAILDAGLFLQHMIGLAKIFEFDSEVTIKFTGNKYVAKGIELTDTKLVEKQVLRLIRNKLLDNIRGPLYAAVDVYIEALNRAYRNKTALPFAPKYCRWYGKLEG